MPPACLVCLPHDLFLFPTQFFASAISMVSQPFVIQSVIRLGSILFNSIILLSEAFFYSPLVACDVMAADHYFTCPQ